MTWSYTFQNSGTYRWDSRKPHRLGKASGCRRRRQTTTNSRRSAPSSNTLCWPSAWSSGLLFLPFVVYVTARTLNRHGDPAAAARIALLIGILSFCGLAWYLFLRSPEYEAIGIAIEVIAAGAFLVVLFSRRRAV